MRSTQHKGDNGSTRSQRSAVRGKRNSITADNAVRKRRKVDQSPASATRSPVVHGGAATVGAVGAVAKQLPSVIRPNLVAGLPLAVGTGDTGQLGLGPDITERTRPARFTQGTIDQLDFDEATLETGFIQVCAGGMHTVYLTSTGLVATCGCNDEGALGRTTSAPTGNPSATVNNHKESNGEVPHGDGTSTDAKANAATPLALSDNVVDETYPAYVPLPMSVKIVMVSAGDSHTAALDSDGQVWLWGTFRGPNGPIGLTRAGEIAHTPKRLLSSSTSTASSSVAVADSLAGTSSTHNSTNTALLSSNTFIIKIASGQDHLVCLTEEGRLYTMGCGEQGQLGRIAERFARTGGRSGINLLLQPTECRLRGAIRFSDVWAGGFATIAVCQTTGDIFACGLNNYGQLALLSPVPVSSSRRNTNHNTSSLATNGLPAVADVDEATAANSLAIAEDGDVEMAEAEELQVAEPLSIVSAAILIADRREADKSEAAMLARQGPLIQFMLTKACGFQADRGWRQFAVSIHHTLALDKDGHVYAVGRPDYGRLGLGTAVGSSSVAVTTVTRVQGDLAGRCCTWIGCGESCSFAVDKEGVAYSWGMGSNRQLAHGDDEDDSLEPGVVQGKQVKDRRVAMVDAGGQHTVFLAYKPAANPQPDTENKAVGSQLTDAKTTESVNDASVTSSSKAPTITEQPVTMGDQPVNSEDTLAKVVDRDVYMVSGLCGGEPLLVPPISGAAPQTRRPGWSRRLSPSGSVCGAGVLLPAIGLSADSTAGSTACATINSSSAVSDTSSVGSCASNQSVANTGAAGAASSTSSVLGSSSTSSQWNSACSTDGGGSSRCSSAFDVASVQSSSTTTLLQQQTLSILSSLIPVRDQRREDQQPAGSQATALATTVVVGQSDGAPPPVVVVAGAEHCNGHGTGSVEQQSVPEVADISAADSESDVKCLANA